MKERKQDLEYSPAVREILSKPPFRLLVLGYLLLSAILAAMLVIASTVSIPVSVSAEAVLKVANTIVSVSLPEENRGSYIMVRDGERVAEGELLAVTVSAACISDYLALVRYADSLLRRGLATGIKLPKAKRPEDVYENINAISDTLFDLLNLHLRKDSEKSGGKDSENILLPARFQNMLSGWIEDYLVLSPVSGTVFLKDGEAEFAISEAVGSGITIIPGDTLIFTSELILPGKKGSLIEEGDSATFEPGVSSSVCNSLKGLVVTKKVNEEGRLSALTLIFEVENNSLAVTCLEHFRVSGGHVIIKAGRKPLLKRLFPD